MAGSGIDPLAAKVLLPLFFLAAPVFALQSWSKSEISLYFMVILKDELHCEFLGALGT